MRQRLVLQVLFELGRLVKHGKLKFVIKDKLVSVFDLTSKGTIRYCGLWRNSSKKHYGTTGDIIIEELLTDNNGGRRNWCLACLWTVVIGMYGFNS